jgi:hypothetical protein
VTQALKKSISYESLHKLLLKIEKKFIKMQFDSLDFMQTKQQVLFDSAEIFAFLEGKVFEVFSPGAKYKTLLLKSEDLIESKEYALLGKKILDLLIKISEIITTLPSSKQVLFASELQQVA